MQKLPTGVRRRKTGLLEKRFSVNGSRYSVYGKNLRQLSVQEQKKRDQIVAATPLNRRSMTTDQYFEVWLEGKKMSVKPSTIRVYSTYYKPYASPFIGSLQLSEITRRDILQVQSEATKKLCPTTNNILLTVIKIMLNEAVEDKLIIENPAKGIKPVKVTEKAAETYHRALTEAEQEQFMDAAKGNYYYELLAFQLLTGMRLGEVGALYWSDIDEKKNVLHVRRTITRTEEGIFYIGDSPKTDAGVRDIPMNEGIKKLLEQQKEKQEKRKKFQQRSKYQMLCFPSPTGQMISHGSVNKNIKRILCKLEKKGVHIEAFTSHALRDTFATRYIEQGGNPQTLKTILGHSSFSMTMDLYSHVLPSTRQEAMEDVYVYINGELREQYASENFENMSYYIPSAYVVVGLSETDAKAEIEIHFRVKTRGRLNAITLGYGNNVWFDVIRKSLPVDVVAFLVLVLGVIVVIVSQAVKHITENARASFSLGLLMIDMAIWVISESNLRQIIFSQPSMAQYYAYFSVEMIVLLAARYFDEVQHRQYHRRTMIVEILIAGQLAINILLKITGVMELYRSLTFSHIWMALGFLVGVVGIVQDIREKRITQYRATALGMLGFLLMAMMELVTFYVSRFHTFGIFVCIGLVILMIATLIQAVLDQVNAAQERERKQSKMIVNTIEIIAGAIDAKDAYTGGHSERVGRYAEILARGMAQEYHFTEQDITRIRYIGVMHDIGKISMADNVLNKAGRLTDEEFSFMKKHVDIGAVLMESMDESVEGLIDGIRYHHERYDGGGYPEGLSGTDIPLIARIICLADCYDVMTSNRVYRKRLADQKVREEFIRCAGTQFDPALTKIFVELMDKGELHPYTVNGMAMSENGEALKSEQLDDYLQHIALSEAGVANYLTHVRMLCYLMKLKEKKGERVDVFIVKLAGSEAAQKNENTNGSRLEDIINPYLKKQDMNIEYNDHIRIVAMFNRKDEEIDRFAEALMETPLQLEMERF